uniref:BZIP domain-containing protein n=1 Tax=Parastrongyloides trichosuri TaxID=131310 RepID=A0A0N4ZDZ5_PARTI
MRSDLSQDVFNFAGEVHETYKRLSSRRRVRRSRRIVRQRQFQQLRTQLTSLQAQISQALTTTRAAQPAPPSGPGMP